MDSWMIQVSLQTEVDTQVITLKKYRTLFERSNQKKFVFFSIVSIKFTMKFIERMIFCSETFQKTTHWKTIKSELYILFQMINFLFFFSSNFNEEILFFVFLKILKFFLAKRTFLSIFFKNLALDLVLDLVLNLVLDLLLDVYIHKNFFL